jgi:hypothetical protein
VNLPFGAAQLNPSPKLIPIFETESAHCALPLHGKAVRQFLEYSFAVFYLLPMILLIILYAKIGMTISGRTIAEAVQSNDETISQSRSLHAAPNSTLTSDRIEQSQPQSRTSVIKMLGNFF